MPNLPNLQVAKGIQALPGLQVPAQWDPSWFLSFIQTWLSLGDVRNATGVGIDISGNASTPATLTVTNGADPYNPTFQSGQLIYMGPNGLTGDNNWIVGKKLPNPSGIVGPAILLGSGDGGAVAGSNISFWILQDQAFHVNNAGNDLGITAGETQPGSSQRGGQLFIIAGASDLGPGGLLQLQGGTSAHGAGGLAVLQGGNATGATSVPGDAHIIAGEVGSQGANVHLTSTTLLGIPGVIRVSNGSDVSHTNIMLDFIPLGAAAGGSQPVSIYIYSGGGYGTKGQPLITDGGDGTGAKWFSAGFSGDIPSGHTIHVSNGLITGFT